MNKEELYKLALSDIHKYSLLNEIFAIRDTRIKEEDYDICVNGFISLDVLNQSVEKIQRIDKAIEKIESYYGTHYDVYKPNDYEKGIIHDLEVIESILKGENNE